MDVYDSVYALVCVRASCVFGCACVHMCHVCVHMCVCDRQREREINCVCVCATEKEGEIMCVFFCVRLRERMCVCVCLCATDI